MSKIKVKDDLEAQKAQEYIKGYYDGVAAMLNQLVKIKESGKSTKYVYKTIKKNAEEYSKICKSQSQK